MLIFYFTPNEDQFKVLHELHKVSGELAAVKKAKETSIAQGEAEAQMSKQLNSEYNN